MRSPHENDLSSLGISVWDEEAQQSDAASINFSEASTSVDNPECSDRFDLERPVLKSFLPSRFPCNSFSSKIVKRFGL